MMIVRRWEVQAEGGVLMKMHAVVFQPLTLHAYNARMGHTRSLPAGLRFTRTIRGTSHHL